jgi:uncharacterized protein
MTHESSYNYPLLVDEALRAMVQRILRQTQHEGLDGNHHFYISFNTSHSGVHLSPQLRERYPEEMTIVVQHQYWDLEVHNQHFSLMLSFNNIPEKLVIPFEAVTAFADPSVRFGVQFHTRPDNHKEIRDLLQENAAITSFEEAYAPPTPPSDADKVISLDAFRKN